MTATPIAGEPPAKTERPTATLAEAVVVLGVPVVVFLGSWLLSWSLYTPDRRHVIAAFSNNALLGIAFTEGLLTAGLLPWLLHRGWKPTEAAGSPVPSDVVYGITLSFGTMIFFYAFGMAASAFSHTARAAATAANPFTGAGVSIRVAVFVAVANGVFEEFLWLVYAIPTISNRLGVRAAAVISAALRLSVHAYQGIYALLGVLPVAIVFTWYYAKTRRVWPVIVAHVFADALAFGYFVR